jgi:predicted dehydrogenase
MLAQGQHLPNMVASSKARLQAICDVNETFLKECVRKFSPPLVFRDFREAIAHPEVDALCLVTTEKLRLPVIEAAAAAGKPIYVEKPLARSMDEVYAIQRVVRESGIPFCVGHNRRASPAMLEAHRIFRNHMEHPAICPWRYDREGTARHHLADDGVAGIIVRINDDWYSWKNWVFDKEQAPHGAMLFEMTHFTDICNWFMGAEPLEVSAMESGMLNHSVSIRYKTGGLATIMMCSNGTFGYGKELYEMMGNGGYMAIDHLVEIRTAGIAGAVPVTTFPFIKDRHPKVGAQGGITGWLEKKRVACEEAAAAGKPELIFTAEPDRGHIGMLARFCDQIRGQGTEVCGVDTAVLATRVAMAAVRSAAERRIVMMSEV